MDKEILDGFKQESNQILSELNEVVENLENADAQNYKNDLSQFAQKIDRIMGAAKTLALLEPGNIGLKQIGQLAALCKALGYKAAEANSIRLLPFFSAFWADTLEVVAELIACLEQPENAKKITAEFSSILQKRLEWLSQKVQSLAPAGQSGQKNTFDGLLKELGISFDQR